VGSLRHSTFIHGPLQQADISFVLEEIDRPLVTHKAEAPMIPASNMKLLISAAALLSDKELLPPLQTRAAGKIASGVLEGDLILDSCGSPIFSARFPTKRSIQEKNIILDQQVKAYVKELKEAGVTRVTGDLRISFDRWHGSSENSHYSSSAAFSFHENTLDTSVENGHFLSCPEEPQAFTATVNKEIPLQTNIGGNLISYNPEIDSRDYWRLSEVSAVEYSRLMLKKCLSLHGVDFLGKKQQVQESNLLFTTDFSEALTSFIEPMNKWSDNYRAEILALQLARAHSGRAEYKYLNSSLAAIFEQHDLKLSSINAVDGSGLSRGNRVSAGDVNKLLQFMSQSAHYNDYKSSLAVAGESGTLKGRFRGTAFEKCFFGKTGTLDGVSSLSGYWQRAGQPLVTMAFIGNGIEQGVFWQTLEKFAASL
jgi:serine-type D-Ala-D-Ala carboxypeptidase/endopeptidase (penicillin-binding protein 4)